MARHCGYCGQTGHNKRTCTVATPDKKYRVDQRASRDKENKEYRAWRRPRSPVHCSWCAEAGHTTRTCVTKTKDLVILKKWFADQASLIISSINRSKVGVGSVVTSRVFSAIPEDLQTVKDDGHNPKYDYSVVIGILLGINWERTSPFAALGSNYEIFETLERIPGLSSHAVNNVRESVHNGSSSDCNYDVNYTLLPTSTVYPAHGATRAFDDSVDHGYGKIRQRVFTKYSRSNSDGKSGKDFDHCLVFFSEKEIKNPYTEKLWTTAHRGCLTACNNKEVTTKDVPADFLSGQHGLKWLGFVKK